MRRWALSSRRRASWPSCSSEFSLSLSAILWSLGAGTRLTFSFTRRSLRRQEQLVASYVDDANSRRQFEDAASLKASLDELREEIRRVRATLT